MPKRKIEGQVAQILNDRELVINRGEEHGVEVGMRFAVLAAEGIGIMDPETGEPLGDIERPKTLVKVSLVQQKLCVAATYRTKTVGTSIFETMIGGFEPPHQVEETLRADKRAYARPLSKDESIVSEGDKVVQVVGDEFAGWGW